MSGMDRLPDEELVDVINGGRMFQSAYEDMARELLAHRRASQAAPAPSDGLREAAQTLLDARDRLHDRRRGDFERWECQLGILDPIALSQIASGATFPRAALTPAPAQEGPELIDKLTRNGWINSHD